MDHRYVIEPSTFGPDGHTPATWRVMYRGRSCRAAFNSRAEAQAYIDGELAAERQADIDEAKYGRS